MLSKTAYISSFDSEIQALIRSGKRISFVAGNFNVVHPGHLRLFKFAAEIGDALVVGVTPDSWPGVTVPSALRLEGVASIGIVKHAVQLDGPPEAFIARLKPDFVIKGKEFEDKSNAEDAAVRSYGGKLLFTSGEWASRRWRCCAANSPNSTSRRSASRTTIRAGMAFLSAD